MMAELSKSRPHHIHLAESGGKALSLDEWLNAPAVPRSLEDLEHENIERIRRIHTEFGV
jgi:hypothetical protein